MVRKKYRFWFFGKTRFILALDHSLVSNSPAELDVDPERSRTLQGNFGFLLAKCTFPCPGLLATQVASFHEVHRTTSGVSCMGIEQTAEIVAIILHDLQIAGFFGVSALSTRLGGSSLLCKRSGTGMHANYRLQLLLKCAPENSWKITLQIA